ncbi:MAG: HepT-like ribonuclease domain-containing protein [Planctomycetota bacterium]|jgi:uncharacterized protein with HEPN domain
MPRDYRVSLDDILEAAARVREYVHGMTLEDFASDRRTLDAIVRNLEVIGEAVKALPEDVRSKGPDVEWRRIAGLRDILIHQYFGIDIEIIWDVVTSKVPPLEEQVRRLLDE